MIYESLLLMLVHLIQHPLKSTRGCRWDLAAGGGHHKSQAPLDPCQSSLSPGRALIPITTYSLKARSLLMANKNPLCQQSGSQDRGQQRQPRCWERLGVLGGIPTGSP